MSKESQNTINILFSENNSHHCSPLLSSAITESSPEKVRYFIEKTGPMLYDLHYLASMKLSTI
jgi:hypothetical protein